MDFSPKQLGVDTLLHTLGWVSERNELARNGMPGYVEKEKF